MSITDLTNEERNALLKAASVHIISLRKRIDRQNTPPQAMQELESELELCVSARNKVEKQTSMIP